MALFLRQDEQRSEVQKRVATELQERLRQGGQIEPQVAEPSEPDDQHTTRPAGMVIIVLLALMFIALVVFVIRIS